MTAANVHRNPARATKPTPTSSDSRTLGCAWLAIALGRPLTDGDRAALVELGVQLGRDPARADVEALASAIARRGAAQRQDAERETRCREMDQAMGLVRGGAWVERGPAGARFHLRGAPAPSKPVAPAPPAPRPARPAYTSPEAAAMDLAMGTGPSSPTVHREGGRMVFPVMTPDQARRALEER